MGLIYPYNLSNGTTADADEVMANFNEIKNNFDFDTLDDASANAAAMQATTDPYPAGTESLATDGLGELKRLRYVLSQILGTQYWYIYPDMVTKTTTYTATVNDRVILCDTSGGAWTLTLPTAVGNQHKEYIIVLGTAGNDLTIDGNGSETIAGDTTKTLSAQYEALVIVSDNSNWQVIGSYNIQSSGTYTPTLAGVLNVSTAGTVSYANYMKIGNIVHVSAKIIGLIPTSGASDTTLSLTLPVSSNLGANDLAGAGTAYEPTTPTDSAARVGGNGTTDVAEVYFRAPNTNTHQIFINFSYTVI